VVSRAAWVAGAALVGSFAALLWLEQHQPLRRQTCSKRQRDLRNLAMAAVTAATVRVVERPVTDALTARVERRRNGLVPRLGLPGPVELALTVVLLDYTLYVWHVLTHKLPLLWRFHRVHHADLDMDATTALRFHFGEMLLSVPWRAAQVALIGVSRQALGLWQALTLVAITFHHANWRLPTRLERRLCRWIMTPRMHGIHHSVVDDERDANWSTILSFPDYLHGTARLDVPQHAVTIGVPGEDDPRRLTLHHLMIMPFAAENPARRRAAR
jgi:sterol desaturase/sphingolipid hydroxylase (fatty acid hydroxylase superfamily)